MAEIHGAGERVQLSTGPTPRRRAVIIVMSSLGFFFAIFMALAAIGLLAEGDYVTGVLFALIAVVVTALIVQVIFRVRNSVFWLEGTTLEQSHFRRNLRCDLVSASLATDSIAGSWWLGPQVPRLITVQEGGAPVILPLRDRYRGNALLAPAHLRRLADIVGSRGDSEEIAGALRKLASDPFDLQH